MSEGGDYVKGMGGLLLLAVLAIGGYVAWTQLGGEVSGSAPEVGTPDISAPSVNESAGGIQGFFNDLADEITTWGPAVWQILAVVLMVGAGMFIFKKIPAVVWAVLGAVVAVVLIAVW